MSYPLIAADINRKAMRRVLLPPSPSAEALAQPPQPHHLRPRRAPGRRQLSIPKYQGENILLQASHLPHALM